MIEIVGKDPCPGLAKVLYIEYTLREHAGKEKYDVIQVDI